MAWEDDVRGRPPDERCRVRQARAGPLLDQPRSWFDATLPKLSGKSELAGAIRYARARWRALLRYRDDGRLEIDNNAAGRALRGVALGRKNWLFAGSDKGGVRAAAIFSLIETAKLNGVDPEAYLRDILARIADYSISRVDELLPWYRAKPACQSGGMSSGAISCADSQAGERDARPWKLPLSRGWL
jgi:transposase